jgi:hypothetical protein
MSSFVVSVYSCGIESSLEYSYPIFLDLFDVTELMAFSRRCLFHLARGDKVYTTSDACKSRTDSCIYITTTEYVTGFQVMKFMSAMVLYLTKVGGAQKRRLL